MLGKVILGLYLADFRAVIRLYSQCQKVSFSPNFSEENSQFYFVVNDRNHIIVKDDLKLFVQHVEYSTLHSL